MLSIKAIVEPLPLVPATVITLNGTPFGNSLL